MRETISKKIRDQVKAKFNGHCAYCGCKPDKLQIDHLIPVSRQGFNHNDFQNLMPSCFSCNNYKTTYSIEDFRREIASQVGRCRQYSVNFRIAERFGLISETKKEVKFYFEEFT